MCITKKIAVIGTSHLSTHALEKCADAPATRRVWFVARTFVLGGDDRLYCTSRSKRQNLISGRSYSALPLSIVIYILIDKLSVSCGVTKACEPLVL